MLEIDLITRAHTHTQTGTTCTHTYIHTRRRPNVRPLGAIGAAWSLASAVPLDINILRENPFTNPGMPLRWISGSDISPMWMSPWLNRLKSASSALHSMYYSPLICQVKAVWVIYNSFCSLAEARSDLFG